MVKFTMSCLRRRLKRKFVAIVALFLVTIYVVSNNSQTFITSVKQKLSGKTNMAAFLVDTPACKIPKVDPYDLTVRNIVRKTGSRTCRHNTSLTYEDGLQLRMNWTAINSPPYNGDINYCTYTPIYRPKYEPTTNNHLRYLDESEPFNDSVPISDEFVRAACYDNTDERVYINFHAFIQPNVTVDRVLKERLKQHAYQDKITERLNVIMIGIDSVSRLSFLRQMTKTHKFLSETLDAVDMMGYNKVADNTFINIVPMTLGKFVAEMPWDETMAEKPFDDFDFIWKQYSQKGYRTFYAEDAPEISIFDFLKAGFKTPPTDYFNRPVSLAMETKQELWSNGHNCFQDRLETEVVLDYLYNFVDTFRSDPYFAFTFITRLTHDDVNSAGAADEPYYKFFKKLHDNELLRNTVLFFFSDHGMRFGKIRETYIGKLEERLPFMFVAVPKWLKNTHPYLNGIIKTNQNRLSTPFDVYETLKDILYFNGIQQQADTNSRGVSWLREIPIERSCDHAGILPHWCTCLRYEKLPTSDKVVQQSSFMLLAEIVHELANFTTICENLSLLQIKEATRLVESDEVLRFKKVKNEVMNKKVYFGERTKPFEDIQVVIVTSPGHAIFEATVRIDTALDTYKIMGDISRINIYGHQSDCMGNFKLKKFCQCRESTM